MCTHASLIERFQTAKFFGILLLLRKYAETLESKTSVYSTLNEVYQSTIDHGMKLESGRLYLETPVHHIRHERW